tara:strand:+ start:142 stop:378 length:237 start_codon:yes stop_codon:yes gene_type:complete
VWTPGVGTGGKEKMCAAGSMFSGHKKILSREIPAKDKTSGGENTSALIDHKTAAYTQPSLFISLAQEQKEKSSFVTPR